MDTNCFLPKTFCGDQYRTPQVSCNLGLTSTHEKSWSARGFAETLADASGWCVPSCVQ